MYRIWRSPYSEFGKFTLVPNDLHDETVTAVQVYTDEVLKGIAESGFNGIWVHGLLHNLVTAEEFPEFGRNSATHLKNMRELIKRGAAYGIKVFIYMQPPRAIQVADEVFWKNHADVAGQEEDIEGEPGQVIRVRAICTSTSKVKNYLKNAAASLAESLPGLGGVIMITASEYPAHCVSRRGRVLGALGEISYAPVECPRCAERKPEDIVSEVITLIRDGIRSVSKDMAIIAWNWSWSFYVDIPCAEIIRKLPKDVILMADFERGGFKDVLGHKQHKIDEYSIGYAGPSGQFKASFELARDLGLSCMAKLQFGTTHELATVPNLPVLGNLFQKADFLRKNNLAGFMGCWNFGNMITANTAGFNYFLSKACPDDKNMALQTFAEQYFPGCRSDRVAAAWDNFADAMNSYPICIPYLYAGPTNYAIKMTPRPEPLDGKSAGRSWLLDERGDDVSGAIADFSLDEIIEGFKLLSEKWRAGVTLLSTGLNGVSDKHAEEELANAEVCRAAFRSTYNVFRTYKLRKEWNPGKLSEYLKYAADELENVKRALPYIEKDKRLGYHSEAQGYMFDAASVKAKIKALEQQLS